MTERVQYFEYLCELNGGNEAMLTVQQTKHLSVKLLLTNIVL